MSLYVSIHSRTWSGHGEACCKLTVACAVRILLRSPRDRQVQGKSESAIKISSVGIALRSALFALNAHLRPLDEFPSVRIAPWTLSGSTSLVPPRILTTRGTDSQHSPSPISHRRKTMAGARGCFNCGGCACGGCSLPDLIYHDACAVDGADGLFCYIPRGHRARSNTNAIFLHPALLSPPRSPHPSTPSTSSTFVNSDSDLARATCSRPPGGAVPQGRHPYLVCRR